MMPKNISKTTIREILKVIIPFWQYLAEEKSDNAIAIIKNVWADISNQILEREYVDVEEDILQHYFRNSDYEAIDIFENVLKVYSLDFDSIVKLIESALDTRNFIDQQQISNLSMSIDYELEKDDLRLVIIGYDEFELPIQKVELISEIGDLPQGIKVNDIPFYLEGTSLNDSKDERYFLLSPNKGWNDYSVISVFTLTYYWDFGKNISFIGKLRIIHYEDVTTWSLLPEKFFTLSNEFCSLAYTDDFYANFSEFFSLEVTISILFALKDAAYFSDIADKFSKTYNFRKSLLRPDNAERYLREVRPKLNGANMENFYSFNYKFKPAYSKNETNVNFNFNTKYPLPDRIFGIIGKNGAGKTQLMNSLPHNLANKNDEAFNNSVPSFSKIIAVSYSVFDNFPLPKKNVNLNYVYCGLKNEKGTVRSDAGLSKSFHFNWKRIQELQRVKKWRRILLNFIDKHIVDAFIDIRSIDVDPDLPAVNKDQYDKIKDQLSSGQSILLYIITQIVANIRLDSLILYDEPETHLHPNAVVELMNTIYDLVNEFESFCIIATHSPIVIRELFSKNVYILERDNDNPIIRRIGIESFGENLGTLTEEVFGERESSKQYKKIIVDLIDRGMDFDEIVDAIEFDEMPLSLNARIYIKNILDKKNEK
ncbi:AAA family ATPase [Chryseobacterium sp. JUb7]|uniref:AAA family ATPase n=1 Tax=Chryseobacterium sp. JUb7 TaxID=2940599 RepID=UPI002167B267|nr:AAA family ATPase [Chryseobacterium sp. JUb7]MCS3532846.1 ABC-type cobalamin/Fe3+-siderophores transport system ATPase subunit [Chryseobacterium sp. JUb7]